MEENQSGQQIFVKKASGELVPYIPEKLRLSLFKAGAKQEVIDRIAAQVESELTPEMTTNRIYQRAFTLLRRESRPDAARYKLKRAIMELGPSGYPFEQYTGELLKRQGFDVEVGVMVQGKCIMHEVDVLGDDGHHRVAVECKFGNKAGKKLDVKVALYIQARFLDIAARWAQLPAHEGKTFEGWIVTNAEFTQDALTFGTCAGLHLISWNFPEKGNLKQLVENTRLYPVTALTSITKKEKQELLSQGTVLAHDLLMDEKKIDQFELTKTRKQKAMDEIHHLCG
ncbi:MAG: restriction endonuclease [Bacteroidota bacterium]